LLITPEVILVQFLMASIVYFLAREYKVHLGKILVLGAIFTIIWPIAAIDPNEVDFEILNTSFQSYSAVFANQIVGIVAGIAVPHIGNYLWIKRK